MEWYEIIVSIISGLAVTIPLVIKLVEYVKLAIQAKNWNKLVELVMNLMAEAEDKFDNGDDRHQWVLEMVEAGAEAIDYPIDLDKVSALITSLCELSKKINTPKE